MRTLTSYSLAIFLGTLVSVSAVLAQENPKPQKPGPCTPDINWSEAVKESVTLEYMPRINWKAKIKPTEQIPIAILDETKLGFSENSDKKPFVQKKYETELSSQCNRQFHKKKDKDALIESEVEYVFQTFKYFGDTRGDNFLYDRSREIVKKFWAGKSAKATIPYHYKTTDKTPSGENDYPHIFEDGGNYKPTGCIVTNTDDAKDFFNAMVGYIFRTKNAEPYHSIAVEYRTLHELYHCSGANEALADAMAIVHMTKKYAQDKQKILEFADMLRDARYISNFVYGNNARHIEQYYNVPFCLDEIIHELRKKDDPSFEPEFKVELTPEEHIILVNKMMAQASNPLFPQSAERSPFEQSRNGLPGDRKNYDSMEAPFGNNMHFLKTLNLRDVRNLMENEKEAVEQLYRAIKKFEKGFPDAKIAFIAPDLQSNPENPDVPVQSLWIQDTGNRNHVIQALGLS